MWGSIGWGGLSVAAGWLVGSKGLGAGFAVYCALSLPCVLIAWKLRSEAAAAAAQGDDTRATADAKATEPPPVIGIPSNKPGQPNTQKTTKQGSKAPTATIICSADPDSFPEDLHTRLLQGTPNSSCAGSEYGGSNCSGSRPGTPDLSMFCKSPRNDRCESPFSRFAQGGDLPDCHPPVASASPFAGSAQSPRGFAAGVSPSPAEHDSSGKSVGLDVLYKPAVGEDVLIRAVYQTADDSDREQLQGDADLEQHGLVAKGIPVVPTLAAAQLSLAATIDAAGVSEAVPAVAAVRAVAPKHSAQLDRGSLNGPTQLQPSYCQLDTVQEENVRKAAAADHHQESEDAPLLSCLAVKQPLSADSPAKAAAVSDEQAAGKSSVTVGSLLLKPAVLVFLWRALIIGLGLGAIGNFLFL